MFTLKFLSIYRDVKSEDKQSLFPCWSHEFLIDQTRNIPLQQPVVVLSDLEQWKHFKWLKWAEGEGMITQEQVQEILMSYKVVSAFKNVTDLPPDAPKSKNPLSKVEVDTKSNKGKNNKKTKQDAKNDDDSNKTRSTIKDEKSGKPSKLNSMVNIANPSFWINHEAISNQINTVTIYFKPSKFKRKIEITDIESRYKKPKKNSESNDSESKKHKSKKERDEDLSDWNILLNPIFLRQCRNEPLYIFTDSIDSKFLVITLSQSGHVNSLQTEKPVQKKEIVTVDRSGECDFCLASVVKKIKAILTAQEEDTASDYVPVVKMKSMIVTHDRPISNFVLEEYNWKDDSLGKTTASLNSYGTKTVTLEIGPGRKLFKLWIKSETPYVMQVVSDTDIVVDNLETIMDCMVEESQLLQEMCVELANNFGLMVQAFGTPEFPERLKAFYKSYKPDKPITKAESTELHDGFYKLLCELVLDNLSSKDVEFLSIALFRWQKDPGTDYPEVYR